jgi:hypothetical protein
LRRAAWLLATSRDPTLRNGVEAAALGERAARLTGNRDAVDSDGLAAAYAESGRFADAVETGNRALRLAAQRELSAAIQAGSACTRGKGLPDQGPLNGVAPAEDAAVQLVEQRLGPPPRLPAAAGWHPPNSPFFTIGAAH